MQHFKTVVNYARHVTETARMFSILGHKEKNHLCPRSELICCLVIAFTAHQLTFSIKRRVAGLKFLEQPSKKNGEDKQLFLELSVERSEIVNR